MTPRAQTDGTTAGPRFTFLGTGTSQGVPIIGCDCPVCRSDDPRNRRLRSSLLVEDDDFRLLVDITPDFRTQALRAGFRRLDAIVITHPHVDHLFGLDDIRAFNDLQGEPIPLWGSAWTLEVIRDAFGYIFRDGPAGTTRPRLAPREIAGPWTLGPFQVTPLPVRHGPAEIYGFGIAARNGARLVYIPDCNEIPEATFAQIGRPEVMILDALRPAPHPTHFSLPQSLDALRRIAAPRSFITHLTHRLEHAATQAALPPGIFVPYDGWRETLTAN